MIKDTSAQDIQVNKPANYKKRLLLIIAALLLIISAIYGVISGPDATSSFSRERVQIAKVEIKTLVRDVAASGKIVAANAPSIYSPERGFVSLHVKAGDTVTKGDELALLHSPELTNELKQQQSVLQRLEGELKRQHLQSRRDTLTLTKTLDMASVELNAAQRENRRAKLSTYSKMHTSQARIRLK
jgi:HlyD family secretion protein